MPAWSWASKSTTIQSYRHVNALQRTWVGHVHEIWAVVQGICSKHTSINVSILSWRKQFYYIVTVYLMQFKVPLVLWLRRSSPFCYAINRAWVQFFPMDFFSETSVTLRRRYDLERPVWPLTNKWFRGTGVKDTDVTQRHQSNLEAPDGPARSQND